MSALTPVQVDDGTLQIGKNLRSALLNLRLTNATRVIWTDAICINQQDIDERVRQVAIMGNIYRAASRTVVWLGDSDKDTAQAFATMTALGDEAMEMRKNSKIVKPWKGTVFKKFKNDSSLENVILDHPWWRRVWTAQEILLAERAIIVMGRHQADWDFLCSAIRHGAALEIWESMLQGVQAKCATSVLDAVQSIKTPPSIDNPADLMLFYLLHTQERDATDPRDKIFAVLGLINRNPEAFGIQVDYRSPVGDVYRRAMRGLIETSGNLDVLGVCFPFKTRNVVGLPSWVADWSSMDEFASPMMNDSKGNRRTTHASKGCLAVPRWDESGHTLILEGHAIDLITRLSKVQHRIDDSDWNMDDIEDDDEQSIMQDFRDAGTILGRALEWVSSAVPNMAVYVEWEKFVKDLKPTNPDPKSSSPMAIYCQTLCTGTLAPGGLLETEGIFRAWLDTLSPVRKLKALKVDRAAATTFRSLAFLGYAKSTWKSYGEFPAYITHVTERRLGSSNKGYLCLLPKTTEVGDQLTLLKGGRVPVILRPRGGGTMEFVGEAYVHGIMNGEAFQEKGCSEIRIR
ncbi:heterokaryon incompatibility protein-domain-containing protein [Bombardia bombarda]|uniref:Heterokaryon incompatibility protein-domain-containing protein n=1 Tax=Bombardia bombarda TaxID=252184 RepID=A0AA39XID3_9PEZI|nr:heterokaryon incompatibility protein-domain-containing protein [Bombardia bombarda]